MSVSGGVGDEGVLKWGFWWSIDVFFWGERLNRGWETKESFRVVFTSMLATPSSRMDWVVWGTGTPQDRDEVKRREFWVCDG